MTTKDPGIVTQAPIELQDSETGPSLHIPTDGTTANDAADMARMGKHQLLKRNFVSNLPPPHRHLPSQRSSV